MAPPVLNDAQFDDADVKDPKLDDDNNHQRVLRTPEADGGQRTLVATESSWRRPPAPCMLPNGQRARISLSRWSSIGKHVPAEVSSDEVDDLHTLTIPLRSTQMEFTIGRKRVFQGHRRPETIFLTGPKAQPWSGVFLRSFDHLRCYIPQSIMVESYEFAHGRAPASEIALLESTDAEDHILRHLGRVMSDFESFSDVYGPCFVDALGLSIAARLLWLYHSKGPKPGQRKPGPLVKWRLKRTLDYIEAHLSEPIYLSELCGAAGLSRMHFAAQFRAATGYPPYAYILRRRIALAQQQLPDQSQAIADIALRVGFSSQAHFTEAFRRVIGETPARWRNKAVLGEAIKLISDLR